MVVVKFVSSEVVVTAREHTQKRCSIYHISSTTRKMNGLGKKAPTTTTATGVKPPLYRSIYADAVAEMYRSTKQSHMTMGYDRVPPQSKYTEKNRRMAKLEKIKSLKNLSKTSTKQSTSALNKTTSKTGETKPEKKSASAKTGETKPEKKSASAKTVENKVLKNIQQASMTKRLQRRPNMVQETRFGHMVSTEEPYDYRKKKDFGKTPAYITKILRKMEKDARLKQIEESKPKLLKPTMPKPKAAVNDRFSFENVVKRSQWRPVVSRSSSIDVNGNERTPLEKEFRRQERKLRKMMGFPK